MVDESSAFLEGWHADRKKMKAPMPKLTGAFGALHQTVMKDGALSTREKELIALGISLTDRCAPCINLHVQGCLKTDASQEQVLEAAGVAVVMQGGPAFTNLPEVLHAFEHLQQPVGS